ncbi:MAG: cobalamin-dependent protein [Gammaproteobacteria bacterium]|nr:cobalamin-dependent protein [Gammaproteobacteria bacterium]
MSGSHTIADVSRIAGIPKDLLRQWERRYGYPKPTRDRNGDRIYSNEELDKLIAIRHLQEQGKQPGKLMALDLTRLRSMLQPPKVALDSEQMIALLESDDPLALRTWLQSQLVTLGLRAFIHKVLAPATRALGDAWASGRVQIHQEHLYTELVKRLVRQALAELYRDDGNPKVMLTTMQGEAHSLGLLMVEALLRSSGAEVIPFGTDMPISDIIKASHSHEVDVIGLSFSCHSRSDEAIAMLSGLRQQVDPKIRIWVGGAAFSAAAIMPEGVRLIATLDELEQVLRASQQRELRIDSSSGS